MLAKFFNVTSVRYLSNKGLKSVLDYLDVNKTGNNWCTSWNDGNYPIDFDNDWYLFSTLRARITNGEHDILLGTREGKSIRFSETNVRASGRKTMGVRGIRLSSADDYVVGMLVVKREGTILVATEKGYGKRTDVIQYRTQTRGGKGVLTMRCTDKTGKMVKIMEVVDSDDLIVITDAGVLMRQPIEAIRTIGRVTQGVRLVKLDDGSSISSITRVMKEAEKKDSNNDEPKEDKESPEN